MANFTKIDLDFENTSDPIMATENKKNVPNCENCSTKCYPACYTITKQASTFSYGQTSDAEDLEKLFTCSPACHKVCYRIGVDSVIDDQLVKWKYLYTNLHPLTTMMLKEGEPEAMDFIQLLKATKLFIAYMEAVKSRQYPIETLLQIKYNFRKPIGMAMESFHDEKVLLGYSCKMNKLIDTIVKLEMYV